MFVHMEDIEKKLAGDILESHITAPSNLRAFKFMENDIGVQDESVVFLCRNEEMQRRFFIRSPLKSLNLLIVGSLKYRPQFLEECNYIVVQAQAADGSYYINKLCDVFLRFYEWEQKLFSYSRNEKSIKEVCDTCFEMTGISMMVMDVNHQPLAISASGEDSITYYLEKGYSYSYLNFVTKSRPSIKEIDEAGVVDIVNPVTNDRCMGYRVQTGHTNNIYVLYYKESDAPWDKADVMMMDYFVNYLEKGILHGQVSFTPYKPYVSDTLEKLITDRPVDLKFENDLVTKESDAWTLLCIEFRDLLAFRTIYHFDIIKQIKDMLPSASCALIHASIAVLYPGARGNLSGNENLKTLLATNDALCIRSVAFTDLSRVSQIWKQLKFVIDVAARDGSRGYYFYADFVIDHCRAIAFEDFPQETMLHSSLLQIQQYDEKNDTDYLKSLVYYLHNNCSINKTAEALSIHRNSLLYRIRKIEDILGYDISSSENRLDMLFSSFFIDLKE